METVRKGDRIAQLVLERILTPEVMETEVSGWSCDTHVIRVCCRSCPSLIEVVGGLGPLVSETSQVKHRHIMPPWCSVTILIIMIKNYIDK